MTDIVEGTEVADEQGDGAEGQQPGQGCPSCGEPLVAEDHFCENCGADLSGADEAAAATDTAAVLCPTCGIDDFDEDGFCRSCGLRRPVRDRSEIDLGRIAAVTDRGKHHERNEDGMALRLDADGGWAVLVVCDGVSSSDDADTAARAAADTAIEVFAEQLAAGAGPATATGVAVAAAAAAVAALGAGHDGDRAPACTFVSAVVTPDTVTVGWLGDSRAYWLAAEPEGDAKDATAALSQCLTVDDSWATRMVAAGLLEYEDAESDPRAHALTAWLGADADPDEIAPHVRTFAPWGPGVVLVCTDGLWNYLDAAELLASHALPAALSEPLAAAHLLADLALDAGGYDNITVALAPFAPDLGQVLVKEEQS